MPLTEDEKHYLETELDKCDAALADKRTLASIYDASWRRNFREWLLARDSMNDVSYPSAYSAPHFDMFYPPDYQYRLDEGARILLAKLGDAERAHLIERFRGSGCLSAEEETLLARGFANEFSEDAIVAPVTPRSDRRPEFSVNVGERHVNVEAKGLLDSYTVRMLGETAIRSGEMCWVTFDPKVGDPNRVRASVVKKVQQLPPAQPGILVFTQYTAWPTPDEPLEIMRNVALKPNEFQITARQQLLAVAYVCQRYIQGVWLNREVAVRYGIDEATRNRISTAIRSSFYPRTDGVFFHEQMDDQQHRRMILKMLNRGVDPGSNASYRG